MSRKKDIDCVLGKRIHLTPEAQARVNKTNVVSGTLTLADLRKAWNSINESSNAPTHYIDTKGLHKINAKSNK